MADKAPEVLNEGAGKVASTARDAAGAIGDATRGARESIGVAASSRAEEKARKLARKTLLDGAGTRMSAERFMEGWATQEGLAEGQGGTGYLDFVGCYVVVTCEGAVHRDDYSRYRDLYVGKSTNMGRSIHDDFTGRGNVDVYADVKYKQHVYVLLYPCREEKLDQLEESLITALDARQSYNAV